MASSSSYRVALDAFWRTASLASSSSSASSRQGVPRFATAAASCSSTSSCARPARRTMSSRPPLSSSLPSPPPASSSSSSSSPSSPTASGKAPTSDSPASSESSSSSSPDLQRAQTSSSFASGPRTMFLEPEEEQHEPFVPSGLYRPSPDSFHGNSQQWRSPATTRPAPFSEQQEDDTATPQLELADHHHHHQSQGPSTIYAPTEEPQYSPHVELPPDSLVRPGVPTPASLHLPPTLRPDGQPPLQFQPVHQYDLLPARQQWLRNRMRDTPIYYPASPVQIPSFPYPITLPKPEGAPPGIAYRELPPEKMAELFKARVNDRPDRSKPTENHPVQKLWDAWDAEPEDPKGWVTIREKMGLPPTSRQRPAMWLFQWEQHSEEELWKIVKPLWIFWMIWPFASAGAFAFYMIVYDGRWEDEDGNLFIH